MRGHWSSAVSGLDWLHFNTCLEDHYFSDRTVRIARYGLHGSDRTVRIARFGSHGSDRTGRAFHKILFWSY